MNREVHITLQKLTLPILAFAILLLSMPSVEAEANLENQKLQTTAEDDHATLYRCPEALVLGESRDGKKQFGLAGQLREDGPAPNEHTLFEIGSITKVFTGILLAEAVREGLVSLDDPVSKFLPPEALAPNGSALDTVTLESLATHTSGLPRLPPICFSALIRRIPTPTLAVAPWAWKAPPFRRITAPCPASTGAWTFLSATPARLVLNSLMRTRMSTLRDRAGI